MNEYTIQLEALMNGKPIKAAKWQYANTPDEALAEVVETFPRGFICEVEIVSAVVTNERKPKPQQLSLFEAI